MEKPNSNFIFIKITSLLFFFSFFPLLHPVNSRLIFSLASANTPLIIEKGPYITVLSLGDQLYLDGLKVSVFDGTKNVKVTDYTVSGYDDANLGTQTITINSGSLSATFDVYVTNELVRNEPPISSELIISEFAYLDRDNVGIEIYNPTSTLIDLEAYSLSIQYDGKDAANIALTAFEINALEAFTISNSTASENLYDSASALVDLDLEDATSIALENEEIVIDTIQLIPSTSWFNIEESPLLGNVIRRHYKTHQPSLNFITKEWIFVGADTTDYGLHSISDSITSIAEQAKAFARYVMFGAGMFAAGRVEEAYLALKHEYELMSPLAKDYFNSNKDIRVEGINESGKRVSVTFREAYGRIGVLASRSGNPSFIPSSSDLSFNFDATGGVVVLGAVLFLSIIGYALIKFKIKKN